MRTVLFFLISIFFISCHFKKRVENSKLSLENKYAKGFIISGNKEKKVDVFNPWQKAENIKISYVLKRNNCDKKKNEICIPVKRVICLSTTHIALIDAFNQAQSIVGISGKEYVFNKYIRQEIKEGKIKDVGYIGNLNYEAILKLNPDVIFVYGVSADVLQSVNKLQHLGINVVITGEYLENDPLGKLEWIKFMASFYGLDQVSTKKFDSIVNNYNNLLALTKDIKYKPKVISGSPWRGAWYISGGKSYMAKLISDAGGNYIWNGLDTHESIPLSFENIYVNSLNSEFWINLGYSNKKSDVIGIDERFANFEAYKNGNMFNNNKIINTTGGNDYYESGITHPDIILTDLIQIFHPDMFPGRELFYYKKLE